MRKFLLLLVLLLLQNVSWSQIKSFDQLEMLYAQKHYKSVYRKSNRLLQVPDFDFSAVPTFYASMSLFQLCQNDYWRKKHPVAFKQAVDLFQNVIKHPEGKLVLEAHSREISILKNQLIEFTADLKQQGKHTEFSYVEQVINQVFSSFQLYQTDVELNAKEFNSNSRISNSERDKIVGFALKHLGVPYLWAGTTTSGFDCSGFTGFVMKEFNKQVPRRAVEQYQESQKVKEKNVQKGDLIFFDNGSGISHVGLIISEPGEPIIMVHASSSKGVVITNVAESEYWMKRIAGYGTFVF